MNWNFENSNGPHYKKNLFTLIHIQLAMFALLAFALNKVLMYM